MEKLLFDSLLILRVPRARVLGCCPKSERVVCVEVEEGEWKAREREGEGERERERGRGEGVSPFSLVKMERRGAGGRGGGTLLSPRPPAAPHPQQHHKRRTRKGERGVVLLLILGLAALTSSALTSYLLPHVLAWRRATGCLPTLPTPCAPEMMHPDLVGLLALHSRGGGRVVTWTTLAVGHQLNVFANIRPARAGTPRGVCWC